MTNQLATVANGRVAFGDAVARVVESLSPLGAAARMIAESTACAVAMKELDVAGRRIDADTEVTLARLENRRNDAAASLQELRRQVGRTDLTAEALRKCIRNMQQALGRRGTTAAEARVYAELIHGFSADLLNHHSQQGNQVLTGIDMVLNGENRPGRAAAPRTGRGRSGGAGGQGSGGGGKRQRSDGAASHENHKQNWTGSEGSPAGGTAQPRQPKGGAQRRPDRHQPQPAERTEQSRQPNGTRATPPTPGGRPQPGRHQRRSR